MKKFVCLICDTPYENDMATNCDCEKYIYEEEKEDVEQSNKYYKTLEKLEKLKKPKIDIASEPITKTKDSLSFGEKDFNKKLIIKLQDAMFKFGGNKIEFANEIGISPVTLNRFLDGQEIYLVSLKKIFKYVMKFKDE